MDTLSRRMRTCDLSSLPICLCTCKNDSTINQLGSKSNKDRNGGDTRQKYYAASDQSQIDRASCSCLLEPNMPAERRVADDSQGYHMLRLLCRRPRTYSGANTRRVRRRYGTRCWYGENQSARSNGTLTKTKVTSPACVGGGASTRASRNWIRRIQILLR
eukprot:1373412-Pleurochrysis_carterae.AAC.4